MLIIMFYSMVSVSPRFVFLQVEISSSCYCRGRAPLPKGKCFRCHLTGIPSSLPSFSPRPRRRWPHHPHALRPGFVRVCCPEPSTFCFAKQTNRSRSSAPPPVLLPSILLSFSLRSLISVLHRSVLFGLVLIEAAWLELFDVTVHVFSLPRSSYLPKKVKMICWICFLIEKKIMPRIKGKPTKELFCG